MGWGTSGWGTGGYGGGSAGISIDSAVAFSTRTVRVWLSAIPLSSSPMADGSATNPATWSIQRLDTLDYLNVIQAVMVDVDTVDVTTFEEFGSAGVTHRIRSTTLRDAAENLITAPYSADFLGALDEDAETPAAQAQSKGLQSRDLSNPQASTPNLLGGTLSIGAHGDYVNVTGAELIRKLIFRRLLTKPGDFFHLPTYGLGLRVKEPIASGNLAKLKTEIESQVSSEPDVAACAATLTLDAKGILTVKVRARIKPTGQQIEVAHRVNPAGVTL